MRIGNKKKKQFFFFFVEANAMNISEKFQFYPPYSFWGVDFLKYFLQI